MARLDAAGPAHRHLAIGGHVAPAGWLPLPAAELPQQTGGDLKSTSMRNGCRVGPLRPLFRNTGIDGTQAALGRQAGP